MNNLSNEAFERVEVDNFIECPIRKVLKLPEIRGEYDFSNISKMNHALCVYILHEIAENRIKIEDLRDYVVVKSGVIKKFSDQLLNGSFKPGQTKKGYGPFFVNTFYEAIADKGELNVVKQLRAIFFVASLNPFIKIEGLKDIVFVCDSPKKIIPQEKIMEVCQAASILHKFILVVDLMLKARMQEGFFHPEEWQLHIKAFRNRLLANLDALDVFSDAVELVCCLTVSHYLRLNNKFMLINSDLLSDDYARYILETEQFFSLGLNKISSIPTLIGPEMSGESLKYNLQAVITPIISSNLLIIDKLDFDNELIYSYKDFALNNAIRGVILVKTCYLEKPISVLRKMDGTGGLYSHSSEHLEFIGKAFSSVLDDLLQVSSLAEFDTFSDRLDYAIKGFYTNLSNQELRLLILMLDASSVGISVPDISGEVTDNVFESEELEKVCYVYRKDTNRRIMEFEDITATRLLDSLLLKNPLLVAISKLHPENERFKKISYTRDKSFFPKFSYTKQYILDASDFSINNSHEEKDYNFNGDNLSYNFSAEFRKLCGVASKSTYQLNCQDFKNKLAIREPLFNELENIVRDSFSDIYSDYDRILKMQGDQVFQRVREKMQNSVFFRRLGNKIYRHIIESVVNSDGKVNSNVSAGEINFLLNQTMIKLVEDLASYILGEDGIVKINSVIEESNQFAFTPLTTDSSNNI